MQKCLQIINDKQTISLICSFGCQWERFFQPKQHSIVMLLGLDMLFDYIDDARFGDNTEIGDIKSYGIRIALLGLFIEPKIAFWERKKDE